MFCPLFAFAISTPDFTKCNFLAKRMHNSMPNPSKVYRWKCLNPTGFDLPLERQAKGHTAKFSQIEFLLLGKERWHKISSVAAEDDVDVSNFLRTFLVTSRRRVGQKRGLAKSYRSNCPKLRLVTRHLSSRLLSMTACYNVIVKIELQNHTVWVPFSDVKK